MLSGYRLMWMIVIFDLPVVEMQQRKAADNFRHFLLDQGFQMAQFSVYIRYCAGKEHAGTLTRRVKEQLPDSGKVDILFITDKQYEKIISYSGRVPNPAKRNPEQYVLF